MAACVEHGIDGARSAKAAAARLVTPASVQTGLRLGLIGPVGEAEKGKCGNRAGNSERHANGEIASLAACFDQADLQLGIFCQPSGHDTAGGTAADDHVIEFQSSPPAARFRKCDGRRLRPRVGNASRQNIRLAGAVPVSWNDPRERRRSSWNGPSPLLPV